MSTKRDTFKYHVLVGERVIGKVISSTLVREETQTRFARLQRTGRRTTHAAALNWLRDGG